MRLDQKNLGRVAEAANARLATLLRCARLLDRQLAMVNIRISYHENRPCWRAQKTRGVTAPPLSTAGTGKGAG